MYTSAERLMPLNLSLRVENWVPGMQIQCCSPLTGRSLHNPHNIDPHWRSGEAVGCLSLAVYLWGCSDTSKASVPPAWWCLPPGSRFDWPPGSPPPPADAFLPRQSQWRRRCIPWWPFYPNECQTVSQETVWLQRLLFISSDKDPRAFKMHTLLKAKTCFSDV